MTIVNLGLIGAGVRGRVFISELLQMDGVQLVAVADPVAQVEAVVRRLGVSYYSDYRDLLKRTDIAAVIVAVPTALHFVTAADALAAGKDVLVEKPICNPVKWTRSREGRYCAWRTR